MIDSSPKICYFCNKSLADQKYVWVCKNCGTAWCDEHKKTRFKWDWLNGLAKEQCPNCKILLKDNIDIILDFSAPPAKPSSKESNNQPVTSAEVHTRSIENEKITDSVIATSIAERKPFFEYSNMKDLLIENRIEDNVRFFSESQNFQNQADGIIKIKKSQAQTNLVVGIVFIVVGLLLFLYYIAWEFSDHQLPWGFIGVGGTPIFVLWGIYSILSSLRRAKNASKITYETDLETLCRTYYSKVFCQIDEFGGKGTKNEQIISVCQFFPVPILENYINSGWDMFIATDVSSSKSQSVECTRCHKKTKRGETCYHTIPIKMKYREEFIQKEPENTLNLIKNLFLKCKGCGTIVCYECIGYSSSKELRYLCPECGKATGGWQSLAQRWMNLRYLLADKNVNYSTSSMVVECSPRSNPHIVDITTQLKGQPFGSIKFTNVAFNFDGKWFLASPEPLVLR